MQRYASIIKVPEIKLRGLIKDYRQRENDKRTAKGLGAKQGDAHILDKYIKLLASLHMTKRFE